MKAANDKKLLKNLRLGSEEAFRKIYTKYHKQLYSVALKYLRNKGRAEDAVHDVFIKLWNNRKKLDSAGSLRGFLFTTVKNHVLNIIKKDKRELKKDIEFSYRRKVDSKDSDNVIALTEYQKVYKSAVKQLPEKRREVFGLKMNDDLTNREVAEYLEVSINTVKSQYYKASKFVRQYVNEHIENKTGS